MLAIARVHAVAGIRELPRVEAPLAPGGGKRQIAISVFYGDVRVLAVLALEYIDTKTRDGMLEFCELLKERTMDIDLAPE